MSEMFFIASDHAGVNLKKELINFLKSKLNKNVTDLGPSESGSVDYPDYAKKLCHEIVKNQNAYGVLICGTGIGMSIAANKIRSIRAALVTSTLMAQMSKQHNNANVLCLGARITDVLSAKEILNVWVNSSFEGDRHQNRINKIKEMESL